MSEMISIARDELAHLEARARKSAMDKSHLQLVISLMNKVSAPSGLEDTIDCMLRNTLDVVGGANILLYYWIDSDIFSADVYGKKIQVNTIDDNLVQQVIAAREPIEHEKPFSNTMMQTPEFTKAYTWVYPLLVGPDIIGVIKMENLHIGMRDLYQYLPTFFNFVALTLKNEILGHTRLQQAYDQLSEAIAVLKLEICERERAEEGLHKAKAQLEKTNRLLETLSVTDPLTGLANRRRFDEALAKEYARHARSGVELSVIMLDIDHFKAFNDRYGHVSGDACLQRIARVIAKSAARSTDIAARYGGEEFAYILPETGLDGAVAIAEKIRIGIKDLAIPHDSSTTADCVTASLGVITVTCDAPRTLSDLIILADTMLYKAKASGRNQLVADASGSKLPAGKNKSLVKLVWKDIFCSGNRLIDTQHRELFRISNELLDAIESLCPKSVIAEIIARLLENIANHFYDEEAILKTVDYPDLKLHVEEHAKLYEKGLELAQAIQVDAPHFGDIFMFLVYDVVFQHMYMKDRKFFPCISSASKRDQ